MACCAELESESSQVGYAPCSEHGSECDFRLDIANELHDGIQLQFLHWVLVGPGLKGWGEGKEGGAGFPPRSAVHTFITNVCVSEVKLPQAFILQQPSQQ